MFKYQEIRNYESDFGRLESFATTNPKIQYTVREKIHGANFQFLIDTNNELKYFSREQEIQEPELDDFYRSGEFIRSQKERILNLATVVKIRYSHLFNENTKIAVFGELAGNMPNGKRIQAGIEYGDMNFYMFEIVIIDDSDPENIKKWYVSDVALNIIAMFCGIVFAPFLGVYTFEQITNTNNAEFSSNVPFLLGVPEPELVGDIDENSGLRNLAEGFIIKAFDSDNFWNTDGHFYPNGRRVIAKWKAAKWSEKKNRKPKVVVKMSDSDTEQFECIVGYINENRVSSVLSKLSTNKLAPSDFPRIVGLVTQDTLKDYMMDKGVESIDDLNFDDRTRLMRAIQSEISNTLRPIWVTIIEQQDAA